MLNSPHGRPKSVYDLTLTSVYLSPTEVIAIVLDDASFGPNLRTFRCIFGEYHDMYRSALRLWLVPALPESEEDAIAGTTPTLTLDAKGLKSMADEHGRNRSGGSLIVQHFGLPTFI